MELKGLDEVLDGTDQSPVFSWVHVPAGMSFDILFLAPAPVAYDGHFVNKKMIPCGGSECKWCAQGIGKQTRCVFSVHCIDTNITGLMEVSRQNALIIRDKAVVNGSLCGSVFNFRRSGHSRKAGLDIRLCDHYLPDKANDIRAPDPTKCLKASWGK